ncbi:hypothetical protein KC351_g17 [Hortaea werneckii]|nr:hypothetical protein KC351_g17 [Hortaea werneckii]
MASASVRALFGSAMKPLAMASFRSRSRAFSSYRRKHERYYGSSSGSGSIAGRCTTRGGGSCGIAGERIALARLLLRRFESVGSKSRRRTSACRLPSTISTSTRLFLVQLHYRVLSRVGPHRVRRQSTASSSLRQTMIAFLIGVEGRVMFPDSADLLLGRAGVGPCAAAAIRESVHSRTFTTMPTPDETSWPRGGQNPTVQITAPSHLFDHASLEISP